MTVYPISALCVGTDRQANLAVCSQCAVTSTLQCNAVQWMTRLPGSRDNRAIVHSSVPHNRLLLISDLLLRLYCYCVGNRDVTLAFPMNVGLLKYLCN